MDFLLGVITTLILVTIVYISFNRQKRERTESVAPSSQHFQRRKDVDHKLKEKLISMLGGDVEAAERLVAKQRFGQMGKSENYYWWQTIRELEQRRKRNNADYDDS